jgi:hypothetical protein
MSQVSKPQDQQSKFTDAVKIWASPVLIIISSYFIKLEFEQMLANQQMIMSVIPELRERTTTLQREMREQQATTQQHTIEITQLKSYFLRPEEIKLTNR